MKKIFLPALTVFIASACFAQKTPPKLSSTVPLNKADIPTIQERRVIAPVYNFSNTRICVDQKEISSSLPPKPVYVPPPVLPKINSNGDLIQPSTVHQGLTSDIARMWSPGDVITVGFATNETTQLVIDKVKLYAKQWETIANIKFQFVDLSQAKVRVGFAKDNTSWSWVGRDVLTNTFNQKTVNFGWFDNTTSETEFRRVILHEFGHVLGFVHEHQSPNANIPWDKEKVYALFALPPDSWDRAKVDANVFAKYSQNSTNSSTYDPSSIMHYFFSADLTTNGMSLPGNTNFSSIDKEFSKFVYPFPPANSNATGLLHTGDDCDEIVFTVEYDVVDKNVVEFILEPGRAPNGNLITWWKKIAIPVVGNGEVGLEMQDGNSSTKTVATSILDKSRGISFGKAKVFGVHTGLGFKWNVLPALRGGCRVRLTWRRDGC
jgi:serralysin